jgi:glycosyltransferase involved in cell wall biosynthesis
MGYDILKKAGIGICVTMDADGQHNPEEIPGLLRPLLEDESDIVIGSRIVGSREKDSLFRLAGVYFFGFVINRLTGLKITDPSSGFRAFKMDVVRRIPLDEDQFHTSELIINAAKGGFRIHEAPVTIMKRKYGKSKKGRDWFYGLNFAKIVIRSWWR